MTNLLDIYRIVIKNMLEKKGRVFLTISGIVIGVFTFTFFMMASGGLENAITEQFSSFGLNVLGVRSVDNQVSGGPPGGGGMTDTDIARIKQVVSDYKYVSPVIFYTGEYEYGRDKARITGISYPDEYWEDAREDLGFEIAEGRFLRSGDSNVVVMGAKATESFGVDKPITLGTSLKINGTSMRVIGILKEEGDLFLDSSMIMPFDTIKEISGQETYTIVRISFFEGTDLQFMQEAIERKLNPNNDEKRVEITSPQQAIEQFQEILGVLQMIIGFVSAIALVVGGINVMNTMYSNILERINEISVIKALGGTNGDVRNMFLLESSILGFIGSIIGFMSAYILAEMLSYVITNFLGYNVPVYFDFVFFLEVVLVTSFFAMLFGTYPAIRAAQVNPAENLRDE